MYVIGRSSHLLVYIANILMITPVIHCVKPIDIADKPRFDAEIGNGDVARYYEDEIQEIIVTLSNFTEDFRTDKTLTLHFRSDNEDVFAVTNYTGIEIQFLNASMLPIQFKVVLQAISIGISQLKIYEQKDNSEEGRLVASHEIKILKQDTLLDTLFLYMVLVWLILSYVTMGAKMEVKEIWEKFKPPLAPIIGMICQFGIMPALSYGLVKLFNLDNATALGLVFVGTCPGGYLSNLFSLLLDCDFVLSLTMTTCSTILSLGFMPLNLFIYGNVFIMGDDDLKTPFVDLFLQLLYLIIPVGLGMFVGHVFPKIRPYSEKLLKPCATLCIVFALATGIPANFYVFSSPYSAWLVAFILPFSGCVLGFLVSKIVCLDQPQAITVALETGAQNSLLANTMLDLFYPKPEADLVGRIPILIALLSLAEGLAVTIIYVGKKLICPSKEDESDNSLREEVEVRQVEGGVVNEAIDMEETNPDVDDKNGNCETTLQ